MQLNSTDRHKAAFALLEQKLTPDDLMLAAKYAIANEWPPVEKNTFLRGSTLEVLLFKKVLTDNSSSNVAHIFDFFSGNVTTDKKLLSATMIASNFFYGCNLHGVDAFLQPIDNPAFQATIDAIYDSYIYPEPGNSATTFSVTLNGIEHTLPFTDGKAPSPALFGEGAPLLEGDGGHPMDKKRCPCCPTKCTLL
ncbi:MAG: hypothetical protein KAT71_00650 [Gammaproteobacteria bacterium]|nr:hypothetical protein [Gammaproteobacteria bacterium]